MKALATIENKIVKFILIDEAHITIDEIRTVIGDPYNEDIWDCNSSNIEVIEYIIDPPEDWIGNKYCYDESTDEKWILNPEYVSPEGNKVADTPAEELGQE